MWQATSNVTSVGFFTISDFRPEERRIKWAAPTQCNPNLSARDTDHPQERETGGALPALLQAHACLSPSQGEGETRGMRKRVLSQRSLYPLLKHLSKYGSQRHSTWGSVSILQRSKSNVELSRWPESLLRSLCLICCDVGKAAEGKVHLSASIYRQGFSGVKGLLLPWPSPHSRSKPAQA